MSDPDIETVIDAQINPEESIIKYEGTNYVRQLSLPGAEFDMADVHESPILRFFEYEHLISRLAEVSKPFCDLA
ncbi:MAG: hypothetical protein LC687_06275, partial [Actinobacteria bacterium]|nr:hypothetical protein [Actinomycetota bacterium]